MVHSVESQSTPYQSTPHVTVYFVRSKQVLSLDIRLVSIQVYSLWGKGGRSIKRGGDYMLLVGTPPSILSLTEWTANVNCKKLALSINLHSPSCDLPKCDVFICICVCVKNGALKRARFCPTQSGQQRRKGELTSVEYPQRARSNSMSFVLCLCIYFSLAPCEADIVITILEMGSLNHRDVKWPARGHTAQAQRSWNSNALSNQPPRWSGILLIPHLLWVPQRGPQVELGATQFK